MKKLLLFGMVLIMANVTIIAQNTHSPEVPFIEVTGSADIEIEPDEISLTVVISGYESAKTRQEVKLEEVDNKLAKILSDAGLSKQDIVLKNASIEGYWHYWRKKDMENNARVAKHYEVIFNDRAQLEQVLAKLPGPKEGILNVNISSLKNKQITEYRKQTKIEAIKAARDKAQYLLESVGSRPGKLIQVIELDEDDRGWYRPNSVISNTISQASLSATNDSGDDNSMMQKIKLRYSIKARFEIE